MASKHDISVLNWTKWAVIAAIASAIAAFLALRKDDASNIIIKDDHSNNTVINPQASSERKEGKQPSSSGEQASVAPAPGGEAILPKKENLWNGGLTNKIKRILLEKGYNSTANVSGTLFLSDPDKIENDRLRYILTLTIDIYIPPSKKPCGQLVYSCPIPTDAADRKDRIIAQGMDGKDGVMEQLEKETDLPSCTTP